uniref:Reverse transcriptase domain-containing protein n=1 Tax=Strongyloides venezuelensis TaxID=75913 RepID=A0A0K0FWF3_STRVS
MTVMVKANTTKVITKNYDSKNEIQFKVKLDARVCLDILLNEADKTFLGIQCPVTNELYSWQRLPFDLNVSTSIAQSIINQALENCEFKTETGNIIDENLYEVMTYIDDILFYTMEESMMLHKIILFCLLDGLRNFGLKVNSGKMEL